MSSTDRQNRLLLNEDWKKIYQSFRYADFKSYDFDTLRRTMINYLRTNYPEDFNDYIESSEYLALIDMIAFLGQNISFRIDLNARENYIDLAERKESVLRLARLVSYNPTRNKPANGLLKFSSIQTTENVTDSNGINLSNRSIVWNDSANSDWYDQFIKIVNAALPVQNKFGKPIVNDIVNGVPTEQYRFNSSNSTTPIYQFSQNINGKNLDFEVVSTGVENSEIVEEAPLPGNQLSFLYRDNGQGAGSNTTGFFLHFRQGVLKRGEFNIDFPVPNQKIDIDVANINHSDVWLYKLDSDGNESDLWTKVDAVEGNNIVYNSLNKGIKDIFSVLTRTDDRVSLIFSDGVFGTLPKGQFRTYYRTSANFDYVINSNVIRNVNIRIPYISKIGRAETLTVVADLKVSVSNAASTESVDSIKTNAPSTYYTQNRLITGEDYNLGPLAISQDIIKTKSVNRVASGISRYYDILDATGKYSNTNIFGSDGVLYEQYVDEKTNFEFITRTDIENVIENKITNILENKNLRNFYLRNVYNQRYDELNLKWISVTSETNRETGYVEDADGIVYQVGSFTEGPLRFLEPEAMIKFVPPAGYYFLGNGYTTDINKKGATEYKWCKIVSISGDGTEVTSSGLGPIIINDQIPETLDLKPVISQIKPKFVRDLIDDVKLEIVDQVFSYRTFGLRYDREDRQWKIILQDDLNINGDFNLSNAGDETGQNLDSSWLLIFETNNYNYEITFRTLKYIFESDSEVRFYYDSNKKIYDSKTGKIVKDKISVLSINTDVNSSSGSVPYTVDFDWEVSSEYRDGDGYVDSKKVEVVFYDNDDDGVIDNPLLFEEIVDLDNYVFTKRTEIGNSVYNQFLDKETYNIIQVASSANIDTTASNNPIYYIVNDDLFYQLTSSTRQLTLLYDYQAHVGRSGLKFQYIHASDENNRIDPSSTNIIDTYILTKQYDTQFRSWLRGDISVKPLPMSSDQMYRTYGSEINKIKSISDEVIYHPVKYKLLFGAESPTDMQATFKIVKNSERVVNDNKIKSDVISAINRFFALENWDFGETFYWNELSTYIMKELSPDLSSIVIVPNATTSEFGSLFEIKAEADEIFVSSAKVEDVEIISAITAERLKSSGNIVTEYSSTNSGIQSSTGSASSTSGGFIY